MTAFADLPEARATGRIAEIYREIRVYCAVPYVSSLQRQLATVPGCLEWLWIAVRPAMIDGRIPEAAWRATAELDLPRLPAVPRPALRVLGVGPEDERTLDGIYLTFLRASPVNMVMASLLKHLLTAEPAGAPAALSPQSPDWMPPAAPPPLPGIPRDADLAPEVRALVGLFSVDMGGATFVPGLYRLLAHWPAYLAHVAAGLLPLFASPDIRRACRDVEARIDAIVPAFAADLAAPLPPFERATGAAILSSLDTYRGTSPQMIVFSAMLRAALPR